MTISAIPAAAKSRPMAALLLAAACCAPALATAASVTYSYKGTNYTKFSGGACLTASMAVSFKFTVKAPLGPNFKGLVTPIAWITNDGKMKFYSKSASARASFTVGTDANGNITSWDILSGTVNALHEPIDVVSVHQLGIGTFDQVQIPCGTTSAMAESDKPGTWSF